MAKNTAKKLFYKLTDDDIKDVPKSQLGGKGFYLKDMYHAGLPVPEAMVLTTDLWKSYKKNKKEVIALLKEEIIPQALKYLSTKNKTPLLSVRSGAPVSMPGMMDTILNLGINKDNINIFLKTHKKDFVYDCYARFLTMYGETTLDIPKDDFKSVRNKKFKSVEEINSLFEKIYKKNKQVLPSGKIEDQILLSILAVLNSWDSSRAQAYRKINNISEDIGTAVVIQKMVFGNKNDNSISGVLFSRDVNTGHHLPTGEYLVCAQGEDVVSGVRTPDNFDRLEHTNEPVYRKLFDICRILENKYATVQDIEFTVDDGEVFILQTRTAKQTPLSKLKTSLDFYKEKLIDAKEVFNRLTYRDYLFLNIKKVDPLFDFAPTTTGLSASNGVCRGRVVFSLNAAKTISGPKIFLAKDTDTNDIPIFNLVEGIVTTVGGVTSHAAVVARGLNKICVVGAGDISITKEDGAFTAKVGGTIIKEGDEITIDADTGRIWAGIEVPIVDGKNNKLLFALEDLIYQAYPLVRVTSNVDEIDSQFKTLYATYLLDNEKDDFVKKELFDACTYLTGVMDLTGKLDYLQNMYQDIPFVDYLAEQAIQRKVNILAACQEKNKQNFSVYLGNYHKKFAEKLIKEGFNVCQENDLDFSLLNGQASASGKNNQAIQIIDKFNKEIEDSLNEKTYAISARNAMATILKS